MQLILLDLHVPGQIDGEELLFALCDQGDEVPIIVVSGWVDDEATVYHPDCVHAVLKKPIQQDHLIETVRLALQPIKTPVLFCKESGMPLEIRARRRAARHPL